MVKIAKAPDPIRVYAPKKLNNRVDMAWKVTTGKNGTKAIRAGDGTTILILGFNQTKAERLTLEQENEYYERIGLLSQFCDTFDNDELQALGSLRAIIQKHNDFVAGVREGARVNAKTINRLLAGPFASPGDDFEDVISRILEHIDAIEDERNVYLKWLAAHGFNASEVTRWVRQNGSE